jgi:hypothetical protein
VEVEELADVVAQISRAVAEAGYADRATLLTQWEVDLRSGDAHRKSAARDELRGVVHGMGGLLDLQCGSAQNTQRVDDLIDLMWQEIRVEP